MKRVMVFTMHEYEQARASQSVKNAIVTAGYTVGDVEDGEIAKLEAAGLVVQELASEPPPDPPEPEVMGPHDNPIPGYYLAWLLPPIVPECHKQIDDTGARLIERHKDWYLFYVVDEQQLDALGKLPWVKKVRAYGTADTVEPLLRANVLTTTWDLILHPHADRPALEHWLQDERIRVLSASDFKIRVEASRDKALECGARVEVAQVLPWRQPVMRLDRARALIKSQPPMAAPGPGAPPPAIAPLTGNGVVVGVADSGIDAAHEAFVGAPLKVIARARPGDGSDPHGHGTHVTGTIGGRPAGANANLRGIAPNCQLVVQSVMDASGALSGLPTDLTELLAEAYKSEVRIHNNSWGADANGVYTSSSLEIDKFVWEHPDMLVVVAAGNAGTSSVQGVNVPRADPGCVEWYSLNAPGTAKNALVVGASRSDRNAGGWSQLTHADLWPTRFPAKPMSEELVSGNAEALGGFSSRGLVEDGRVKPDVVAPGTDIGAPRASTAPSKNFAGPVPGTNRQYAYMSGTSMATPIVSGVAALVREYVQRDRGLQKPSAALLKAILINGARPLTSKLASGDLALQGTPNPHQGFGCIDLVRSIPLDGSFRLAFEDSWQVPAKGFRRLDTKTNRRFQFTTTAQAPLRVTLAYTDVWHKLAQNNLNLFLEQQGQPAPAKQLGNSNLGKIAMMPDPANNVETVKLDAAPAATWIVSVTATVLEDGTDGQHFALVVAGALNSDVLQEI